MINRHAPRRIVLIGMPGSGKTAIARMVARKLGRPWRDSDTDDLIVSIDGRDIPRIFRDSGEEYFRALERQAIAQLERAEYIVLATGGGAVLDPVNRRRLWQGAFVVYLKARPETLAQRVATSRNPDARPLLAGDDPLARLRALLAQREPLYALADWTIQTDGLFPDQTAEEIARVYAHFGEQLAGRPGREIAWHTADEHEDGPCARVDTPSGAYPIYIAPGELRRLGERMRAAGLGNRVTIIADAAIAESYGAQARESLAAAGIEATLLTMPGGEAEKNLATVARLYDALVERRAERGDAIVALGGGVTTDLAGFVAATYLRGVPLVQVPTSLLGMVDAAIGGKTGVDHPRGKNLIGAFYQPHLVLADPTTLRTLARREFIAGWAEVIKHALIRDPALLRALERDADKALTLDSETVTALLRRSAQIKAKIVSGDERESGPRMTLNYGHTIGHALEAATGYSAVLHGEAVAVGMQGAARIAVALGLLQPDVAAVQERVLRRYGLPVRWPGAPVEDVLAAMALDKKIAAKKQRWILLTEVGRTVIRDDVPASLVRETVEELLAP